MDRRLAAILAADMAGYSRLMEADEEGTLTRLRAHRDEIMDPAIERHRGRIIKTLGDGLLAEFASVADATTCAVDIQNEGRERETDVPEAQRIRFRIGINLGDVIHDGQGRVRRRRQRGRAAGDAGGRRRHLRVGGGPRPGGGAAGDRLRGHGRAIAEEHQADRAGLSRPDGGRGRDRRGAVGRFGDAALDRGAALHQHVGRSGPGVLRRRADRGYPDRAEPAQRSLRDLAQFQLRLQGPVGEPARRRGQAGRALHRRGQRSQGGQTGSGSRFS